MREEKITYSYYKIDRPKQTLRPDEVPWIQEYWKGKHDPSVTSIVEDKDIKAEGSIPTLHSLRPEAIQETGLKIMTRRIERNTLEGNLTGKNESR